MRISAQNFPYRFIFDVSSHERLKAEQSILVLVEEEILFCGVVGPKVFDAVIHVAFVLYFLQVLKHLVWGARTHRLVYQFILGCRPGSIFQFGSQFKCPIHSLKFKIVFYIFQRPHWCEPLRARISPAARHTLLHGPTHT